MDSLDRLLYYFYVDELKGICAELGLSTSGKKLDFILRILAYLKSGVKQELIPFPEGSKAKKHETYPIARDTKMMMGSYKNDRATRTFFQSLIGEHFHFTVFGLDWLEEKWRLGEPPTYAEFASFWKAEYERRQTEKSPLKKEWAYLNFVQRCKEEFPYFSSAEINRAWEEERNLHVQKAYKILNEAHTTKKMISLRESSPLLISPDFPSN